MKNQSNSKLKLRKETIANLSIGAFESDMYFYTIPVKNCPISL